MTKRLLLLLLPLFLLAGCNRQEAAAPAGQLPAVTATPVSGDTILQGSSGDATTFLPVLASDSASSEVNELVYNGLVRYDKNLQYQGELAESWEISPDNLVITFHLRKGVKWHDGAPFTAEDVLFTYQTYIDPQVPTAYAENYRQVDKVEILDPLTLRVSYKKPLAQALISWGVSIMPKHLLAGQVLTKSPLASAPVGTGPYRFVEWKRGEKIVLAANPDYFEGRPHIDRVVFRIIPDESTMFLELKAGGIDMMGLTPLQYARQTESPEFIKAFGKYRYPAFAYTYLGYNLNRPLFQDKRVRQALAHAIDKREIIDGVLLGLGQEATGPYKPGTWPHNPTVRRYDYDPAKARELLAAAGWKDSDGDGIVDQNGQPFAFTIVTNQGNDQRSKAGEIIQRRFREVGVDVKLRVVEWASFLKEFINPGKFDATILGWTVPIDPDGYNVWHSSKTRPGELNFIGFRNAEVDTLLEQGRRTLDQGARKKAYDRLQEILADEQPYTFLYVPDALPVVAARFHGIEPAPAGISHNFIRWHVPKSEQKYLQ
ncbi:MAG: peptide-binding protein [Desulfuromonadales bacterium GWC2_61_20]|nr:MAG: peptide-binding protein [Desulfuromonadales bacterium GWC2_61_20]